MKKQMAIIVMMIIVMTVSAGFAGQLQIVDYIDQNWKTKHDDIIQKFNYEEDYRDYVDTLEDGILYEGGSYLSDSMYYMTIDEKIKVMEGVYRSNGVKTEVSMEIIGNDPEGRNILFVTIKGLGEKLTKLDSQKRDIDSVIAIVYDNYYAIYNE